MTFEGALEVLSENGYPMSKAKVYKLTCAGEIPYRKFGNRLVFSRKEILAWAEQQTINPKDGTEAVLSVAKSARKKCIRRKR